MNNPTPGSPQPATPNGTRNNADVGAGPNWVTSYATVDSATGAPMVVNISHKTRGHTENQFIGEESQFHPGYVARWVADGVAHTFGEGLDPFQSPWATAEVIQNIGIWWVWGRQMDRIIEKCKCGQQ